MKIANRRFLLDTFLKSMAFQVNLVLKSVLQEANRASNMFVTSIQRKLEPIVKERIKLRSVSWFLLMLIQIRYSHDYKN
ncbi:hypothetical protein PROH_14145 [Prochlorothrix hollandica PCC 9006 = CALU 1027]|uniref:Uncharacterized protein n=1 Tax=Prochlorothrix hollandica PCC 9006 = CALU 1027 TaxID=317619 RepID=A0A0M2PV43_PROHO|nr:hypothetical protein PROH_14145 [Prochlorothrix hollandica PCC 9006 = CALU 1027]